MDASMKKNIRKT